MRLLPLIPQVFVDGGSYCTVSTSVVVCVVAVIPLLDCAVTFSVYVPAGVGRLADGPWFL